MLGFYDFSLRIAFLQKNLIFRILDVLFPQTGIAPFITWHMVQLKNVITELTSWNSTNIVYKCKHLTTRTDNKADTINFTVRDCLRETICRRWNPLNTHLFRCSVPLRASAFLRATDQMKRFPKTTNCSHVTV